MFKGKKGVLKSMLLTILSITLLFSVIGCSNGSSTQSSGTSAQSSEQAGGKITIGVCTALTGSSPLNGERTKQGVSLAAEEINKAGGILGKQVELIFQDDQAVPNGAVNAVNKLMSQNITAMIGPHLSGNVMAVQAIVQKNQKPMLSGGTSPSLLNAKNPWFFRIRASDSIVAKLAAKYLVENLKAKKIGMIFDNDAYGTGARDVAVEYLNSINIPVFAEGFNSGDKDMTGQLLKLKNNGIEALIIWAHDAEGAISAKQVKQLNLNVPIIGNPGFVTSSVLDLMDATSSEGIYAITDFIPTNSDEQTQKFVSAFKAKYNIAPELYAAAYYNATYVLADAIKRANSTDSEKIKQALLQTKDFKSTIGTLTSNEQGEMVHEAIIAQVKDKKASMISLVKE